MVHHETGRFYENKKRLYTDTLLSLKKKINVISNTRLLTALLFLVVFYFGFSIHSLFYFLPFILFGFVLLVRRHSVLFHEKTHLESLIQIQKDELLSLTGDFSHYSSGSMFVDVHHPYSHDLDIFGEGSVFQYVNRSHTRTGKKIMADRLSKRPASIADISLRQQAARELASKPDFRHEVQALSRHVEEEAHDRSQLEQWLSQPPFIFGRKFYKIVLNTFPVLTIGLVVSAFFVDGLTAYAILSAGLQWVFLGFHLRRINAFHQYISRKRNTLEKFADILNRIRNEKFSSELMQKLGAQAQEGDEKVKQLASLMRAFDARMNSMTNLFVNSLLLYDLQCVYRLEKWKAKNVSRLIGWIDTVHETEVLCSFGTFAFNHSQFVFPTISTECKLSAAGLGHPMLREEERVLNDVYLDPKQSIMIITGANMAGKSTFLRSLGVNVALALAGAPVCAQEFDCPLIEVRSGMRTADSLRENQSYFFAELDRLKAIIDELKQETPLLVLLDEILKGTNSTDKQAGSVALVKQFTQYPCLVVIATHDLALGELEQLYPGRIFNYSFEANIVNDQLFFDYKLKRGIAQKMNATFLMRKMGIIPE